MRSIDKTVDVFISLFCHNLRNMPFTDNVIHTCQSQLTFVYLFLLLYFVEYATYLQFC